MQMSHVRISFLKCLNLSDLEFVRVDWDKLNAGIFWLVHLWNPRHILDLLLSVITVSMKTMEIVESLPRFEC